LAVRLNKKINFHLKIDSDMGRIGVVLKASYSILPKIVQMFKTNMTGMYAHFAVADADHIFTQRQLDIFTIIA